MFRVSYDSCLTDRRGVADSRVDSQYQVALSEYNSNDIGEKNRIE